MRSVEVKAATRVPLWWRRTWVVQDAERDSAELNCHPCKAAEANIAVLRAIRYWKFSTAIVWLHTGSQYSRLPTIK